MASLKEVRIRIGSVNSTMQITKAMKMVAAAKLRKAQDRITQFKPYARKLNQMIAELASNSESGIESPLTHVRDVQRALVIVVTSDRGLCGAFNSNVIKAANTYIQENYASLSIKSDITIMPLGKKAMDYFSRRNALMDTGYADIFQRITYDTVKHAAEKIMGQYAEGVYDDIVVVYNEFKNVGTQILRTERLLPVVPNSENPPNEVSGDFIFEPSEKEIMLELLPKSVMLQLFKSVIDSNAAEHGARMTAMDKATENAGELLKDLKIEYNRSRQAAITKEILEIVGGAEALKN